MSQFLLGLLQSVKNRFSGCTIKTEKTSFFGLWTIYSKIDLSSPNLVIEKGIQKEVRTTFFGLWSEYSLYNPEKQFEGIKRLVFEFPAQDGAWILNGYYDFQSKYPSIWKSPEMTLEKPGTSIEPDYWQKRILRERVAVSSVTYEGTVSPAPTPTWAERVRRA